MSYDFETRRFAPGGARLSAAHLNHAFLGKADVATLAAEARARAEGDVAAVARAREEALTLIEGLRVSVAGAGYLTLATTPVTSVNGKTGDVTIPISAGVAGVGSFNGRTGDVTLRPGDVTVALGFNPYNAANLSGFQTAAQVGDAVAAERVARINADAVAVAEAVRLSGDAIRRLLPDVFTPELRIGGVALPGVVAEGMALRLGPFVLIEMSLRFSPPAGASGPVSIGGLPYPCWSSVPHPMPLSEWNGIAGQPTAALLGSVVRLLRGLPDGVSPELQAADLAPSCYLALSGLYGSLAE